MTEIVLVETAAFIHADVSYRSRIESAHRRIPGVRMRRVSLDSGMKILHQKTDTVLSVPVMGDVALQEIQNWLQGICGEMPYQKLLGVVFLILQSHEHPVRAHESGDLNQWLEPAWTEVLDAFTEIALPTSRVVWQGGGDPLDIFRLVEAVSGLVRELDTIVELRRLSAAVNELEEQISELGARTGSKCRKQF